MSLEQYRGKRDFGLTPEPRGRRAAKGRDHPLAFVIQKHAARNLHYDFRLELDGVLLSWAVPKGPSLDPEDKRLAMHVEDHPLEYGGFEGAIPAEQYGGGTVMVWDRGTWTPEGDPRAAYAKGHLKFDLDGTKLHGRWNLIRTGGAKYNGNGKQAWLLIKEKDAHARADGIAPIVLSAPDSVATGRNLDEIAKARSNVWQSKLSVKANLKAGALKPVPRSTGMGASSQPADARRSALPALIAPALMTLVDRPPDGEQWLFEIKYDGYRMVARIERGKARIYSRNGKEWTNAFSSVADALAALPVKSSWIDGEVCALDAQGRTSFQALQSALATHGSGLTYFAFDVVYRNGYDLRKVPLTERKALLREIIGKGTDVVRLGPEVSGAGDEFFRQACALGLEGIVCKRVDSSYGAGVRTRDWVKVKCTKRQEMVIGGYTEPQGARNGFGALLLGVYADGKLLYAGKVGTGFNAKMLESMYPMLRKIERDTPAFSNPPRGFEAKGAHWVKPVLVGEVAFTEWSNDGALRHPSFQGLRPDKKAQEVAREETTPSRTGATANLVAKRPTSKRTSAGGTVSGVALSNRDKLYFPEAQITKRAIAEHYEFVSKWLLPHIAKRPLSLVRCPDGWNGQCFYQKHADRAVNAAVARIDVPEGDGTAIYMGASTAIALVSLVQWGVIEMHPWGSRQPRLDRPDQLIFDFDPDEGHDWVSLKAAVGLLRTLLKGLGLTSFLKTTGGKGLHVVVPIRPTLTWDDAKGFTRAVAELMAATFPDRFTTAVAKAKRKDRIFLDYLRNAEGATAVAPYSVRARRNAPVATPIFWEELAKDIRFDYFNVQNIRDRLEKGQDPWADFKSTKQSITRGAAERLGFKLTK
jgi:bifunctional non-homologous end joining protein LigD